VYIYIYIYMNLNIFVVRLVARARSGEVGDSRCHGTFARHQ